MLRRYRLAAGWTQEQLAERAGVSVRSISNLERGSRHVPRGDTIRVIAGALGLADEDIKAFMMAARVRDDELATLFYVPDSSLLDMRDATLASRDSAREVGVMYELLRRMGMLLREISL